MVHITHISNLESSTRKKCSFQNLLWKLSNLTKSIAISWFLAPPSVTGEPFIGTFKKLKRSQSPTCRVFPYSVYMQMSIILYMYVYIMYICIWVYTKFKEPSILLFNEIHYKCVGGTVPNLKTVYYKTKNPEKMNPSSQTIPDTQFRMLCWVW